VNALWAREEPAVEKKKRTTFFVTHSGLDVDGKGRTRTANDSEATLWLKPLEGGGTPRTNTESKEREKII